MHDSRNRGERVLMHRGHGNAIDDLLFYNLARDSGHRRVTHFDNRFIFTFKLPIILATDVTIMKQMCKLQNKCDITHAVLGGKFSNL